jgi:hypothetical protein
MLKRVKLQNLIKERIKKIYKKDIEINLPLTEIIGDMAVQCYIAETTKIKNGFYD